MVPRQPGGRRQGRVVTLFDDARDEYGARLELARGYLRAVARGYVQLSAEPEGPIVALGPLDLVGPVEVAKEKAQLGVLQGGKVLPLREDAAAPPPEGPQVA